LPPPGERLEAAQLQTQTGRPAYAMKRYSGQGGLSLLLGTFPACGCACTAMDRELKSGVQAACLVFRTQELDLRDPVWPGEIHSPLEVTWPPAEFSAPGGTTCLLDYTEFV